MFSIFRPSFLCLSAVAALTAFTAPQTANAFSDDEKSQIQEIVREYVQDNPEIIVEAFENFRVRQAQEQERESRQALDRNREFLVGADAPFAGNPDASVTVIEFFDYNCGYCKRALPDIQKALENDNDVRFVFHEMPILGPSSDLAAKWAMAAHEQGKYFEYHAALMDFRGSKTESSLEKLAEDVGLDVEQMKIDAVSDKVRQYLDKSVAVARELGINGTPAFIIGDEIIPGYLGPDGLQEVIDASRG